MLHKQKKPLASHQLRGNSTIRRKIQSNQPVQSTQPPQPTQRKRPASLEKPCIGEKKPPQMPSDTAGTVVRHSMRPEPPVCHAVRQLHMAPPWPHRMSARWLFPEWSNEGGEAWPSLQPSTLFMETVLLPQRCITKLILAARDFARDKAQDWLWDLKVPKAFAPNGARAPRVKLGDDEEETWISIDSEIMLKNQESALQAIRTALLAAAERTKFVIALREPAGARTLVAPRFTLTFTLQCLEIRGNEIYVRMERTIE